MFYKIVSDGKIIDACTVLSYVKWQERNQMFVSCGAADADGLASSDESEIYLFPGKEAPGDHKTVSFAEITEDVYYEILEELEKGRSIDDDPGQGDEKEPVIKDEIVERMMALEETNEMLLECLLEMSEIVYG